MVISLKSIFSFLLYELNYGNNANVIDNTTYFYYLGDECTDITGGWVENGRITDFYTAGLLSRAKNTDNLNINSGGSSKSGRWSFNYITNNTIDVTPYNKFVVQLKHREAGSYPQYVGIRFSIATQKADPTSATNAVSIQSSDDWTRSSTLSNKILVLKDLSYSGNGYGCMPCSIDTALIDAYMYMMAISKTDDISGLSSYGSTISAIITNASSLLANSSAVNYMINKCTGDFMWSALADSSFVTALNNSPNRAKIYNNPCWGKALQLLN